MGRLRESLHYMRSTTEIEHALAEFKRITQDMILNEYRGTITITYCYNDEEDCI